MSAANMARTHAGVVRPRRAAEVAEGRKSLVSGPMRLDQKQRQTSAPGWWGWTWPKPPPRDGQWIGQWSSA
jgi:hypothetical protein